MGKAQSRKTLLNGPEFGKALEKIVLDFKTNFKNIQGINVSSLNNVDTYESTVKLPGTTDCLISYYNSKVDTTASWQAIVYQGEDYTEASQAYKNLFDQVKKSEVHQQDMKSAVFTGAYHAPKEELRFVTSTLRPKIEEELYKNFSAEVELVTNYAGWEVHLNLQTTKPDDKAY